MSPDGDLAGDVHSGLCRSVRVAPWGRMAVSGRGPAGSHGTSLDWSLISGWHRWFVETSQDSLCAARAEDR